MTTPIDSRRAEAARSARPSGDVPPALELRSISKRFIGARTAVLEAVDLVVQPGESLMVWGRNGAGKTTLLRIASGLIAPDAGSVSSGGLSPERDRREYQTRIGFLSAGTSGLYARLTVRQHLEYWARIAFVPRSQRGPRIEECLDDFDLRELAGRRLDRMSMGQRQRVRIAMTFLHRPSLALLDEPASSLDEEGTALLRAAAERAMAHGASLICCSPQNDAAGIAFDRACEVRGGGLVFS